MATYRAIAERAAKKHMTVAQLIGVALTQYLDEDAADSKPARRLLIEGD